MDQIILSWIQEYSTFIIKYIGYFFVIIWFIFWLIMFYWGCEITKFCKNIYRKYRLFFRKLLIPFPKTRDFLIQRFDNSKLSGLIHGKYLWRLQKTSAKRNQKGS
jgi:hypothetical protein